MKLGISAESIGQRLSRACRLFFGYAASDGIPARSIRVALVVGSILNVINQGDAFLGAHAINWIKLVLTFFVPYGVSTYASVAYKVNQLKSPSAPPADGAPQPPDRQPASSRP